MMTTILILNSNINQLDQRVAVSEVHIAHLQKNTLKTREYLDQLAVPHSEELHSIQQSVPIEHSE
jgi:hypothetical protein